MTTIYTSKSGNNANSGLTLPLAKATAFDSGANSGSYEAAANGDTLLWDDGIYNGSEIDSTGSLGYWNCSKSLTVSAINNGSTTFRATGAVQSVLRASNVLTTGSVTFNGLVLDAQGTTSSACEIGDITAAVNAAVTNCSIKTGSGYGLVTFMRRNTLNVSNISIEGSCSTAGFASTSSLGNIASAPCTINITSVRLDLSIGSGSADIPGIVLARATSPLSAVNVAIDTVYGSVTGSATNGAVGILLKNIDSAVVNGDGGKTLTINSTSAADESYGINVYGVSTARADNPVLKGKGQRIEFFAPSGRGIVIGGSGLTDGYCTGGVVSGWRVYGKYYASDTPHGIVLGVKATGAVVGCDVHDIYAAYLMSITDSGAIFQNVRAFDAYGSAFYSKGVTAGKWLGCAAYITGANQQRLLATIHVDGQAGTNTAAVTYDGCMVVLGTDDLAKITRLFAAKVNCAFTMTNCTFIIPDTISDSAGLFTVGSTVEGSYTGGTDYTAAQWESGTAGSVSATNGTATVSVSGCKVIKLPLSVCRKIISGANPQTGIPCIEVAPGVVVPV